MTPQILCLEGTPPNIIGSDDMYSIAICVSLEGEEMAVRKYLQSVRCPLGEEVGGHILCIHNNDISDFGEGRCKSLK